MARVENLSRYDGHDDRRADAARRRSRPRRTQDQAAKAPGIVARCDRSFLATLRVRSSERSQLNLFRTSKRWPERDTVLAACGGNPRDTAIWRGGAGHWRHGNLHGREADGAADELPAGQCRVPAAGADQADP